MMDVFYGVKADYAAMNNTRFTKRLKGVDPNGSGADYHLQNESGWLRMMERARWYDRNDGVIGQGVSRVCDNVVQDGFALDPMSGDADFDKAAASRWLEWGGDKLACHKSKRQGIHSMAWMTLRQTLIDGDILHLMLKDGSIEQAEAHRIRTPRNTTRNVALGVLMDNFRAPVEYWVTKEDVSPLSSVSKVSDVKPYPAFDSDGNPLVLHFYLPTRFSQTRGVTALAPISDYVGMHGDIQFAQLVKQQMASCFAIIRELTESSSVSSAPQIGDQRTETSPQGASTRLIEGMAPGIFVEGGPGEKYTGFSPNVPNAEFFDHTMLILTFFAINLGIPVAVLLLDPTKTNFSGWRGAIDQARIGFRRLQRHLISDFYSPVYRWKVRQWLETDREFAALALKSGCDPFAHRFNPPAWDYIEPSKDASADATQQKNRLISPRRLHARRGRDYEEIAREIVDDNALIISLAMEKASELNKQFPASRVDWREIAGFDLKAMTYTGREKAPAKLNNGGGDNAQNDASDD